MGSGASQPMKKSNGIAQTLQQSAALRKTEKDIITLMMPVYFNNDELQSQDREAIHLSWSLIVQDQAKGFLKLKKEALDPTLAHESAIAYFYYLFYQRFFDVHPIGKSFFMNNSSQSNFILRLINIGINEKADPFKYRQELSKLTEMQNEGGFKAVECKRLLLCFFFFWLSSFFMFVVCSLIDGILGEVLFWTLRSILGQDYTLTVNSAWIKMYSRLLNVIVPIAIAYEMKTTLAQETRFKDQLTVDHYGEQDFEEEGGGNTEFTGRKALARAISTTTTQRSSFLWSVHQYRQVSITTSG